MSCVCARFRTATPQLFPGADFQGKRWLRVCSRGPSSAELNWERINEEEARHLHLSLLQLVALFGSGSFCLNLIACAPSAPVCPLLAAHWYCSECNNPAQVLPDSKLQRGATHLSAAPLPRVARNAWQLGVVRGIPCFLFPRDPQRCSDPPFIPAQLLPTELPEQLQLGVAQIRRNRLSSQGAGLGDFPSLAPLGTSRHHQTPAGHPQSNAGP